MYAFDELLIFSKVFKSEFLDVGRSYLPYKNQPTITPIMLKLPIELVIMRGKLWILRPYSTQIIPAMSMYAYVQMDKSLALFRLNIRYI